MRDFISLGLLSENRFFGREFAGVVKQCGSQTSGFHAGDHIIGFGEDPYTDGQFIIGFTVIDKAMASSQAWAKDKKFNALRLMDTGLGSSSAVPDDGFSPIQKATKRYHDAIRRHGELHGNDESALQLLICSMLMAKMAQVLSIDTSEIRPTQSAVEYGIDSLMAIEVRSWTRTTISVDLPVDELMSPYSIQDLAGRIAQKLFK